MSIKLYMDVQVPRAVTLGLRARGVDVVTAQEDGADQLPDPDLLDRANHLERILFTQDHDFLVEAARRQSEARSFAGIVYAHQLKVTIGVCVRDLQIIAEVAEPSDLANEVEYLPL